MLWRCCLTTLTLAFWDTTTIAFAPPRGSSCATRGVSSFVGRPAALVLSRDDNNTNMSDPAVGVKNETVPSCRSEATAVSGVNETYKDGDSNETQQAQIKGEDNEHSSNGAGNKTSCIEVTGVTANNETKTGEDIKQGEEQEQVEEHSPALPSEELPSEIWSYFAAAFRLFAVRFIVEEVFEIKILGGPTPFLYLWGILLISRRLTKIQRRMTVWRKKDLERDQARREEDRAWMRDQAKLAWLREERRWALENLWRVESELERLQANTNATISTTTSCLTDRKTGLEQKLNETKREIDALLAE